jgi:hypothetical protein
MAQLVERLNALDLAEFIYRKVDAYYEVASCLLQTGKFGRENIIVNDKIFD